jgi:hypothetical protein
VRGGATIGTELELPFLPDALGTAGRYFYIHVFVATLPHIRAYHRDHAIPEHISRHTLGDLGRHMALHRRRYGTGGLLGPLWMRLHFRGEIYQLGRLQFQRARLGTPAGSAASAAGLPVGPGDPSLEIHIPDFSGPMTPAAVEDSLTRARRFFPRHFPDERYAVCACHSWLLDPQLAEYLPASSNIIAFQRRFPIAYAATEPSDTSPIRFVFGDPDLPLDALPRRTTLQRTVVDHLRAGRHWYGGTGVLEL